MSDLFRLSLVPVVLALAACAGASSDPAPAPNTQIDSTRVNGSTAEGEVFWTAFNSAQYEELPNVQKSLEAAVQRLPTDGYLRRILGLSYFWQMAEIARPNAGGPAEGAKAAFTTLGHLERAKELSPTDPWVPCFLGLMQYGMGSALGSEQQKSEALAEFDRGIAMYPQFVTYCRALARSNAPKGSAEFDLAVRDFWREIELCDPTVTKEHPEVTDPNRMGACTQRPRVPHGYNGFWLTAGDALTKAGDLVVARAFYENAKKMNFDTWKQRDALQERIDRQSENAALYADGDATNDPPLSFYTAHSCTMCHGK